MTVAELLQEVALRLGDPKAEKVTFDRLIVFLNAAARDAANEGWYLHEEEDESITLQSNTWDYAVPSGFAYISEIWVENATTSGLFDYFVPYHHWTVVLDGGVPKIRFNSRLFSIADGKRIKVVGQKRPTTSYTISTTQNIDVGMESFLRERTTAYAASFLASAGPEFDQNMFQLSRDAWVISEQLLASHPQQFRLRPNARYVPGR